MLLLIGVVLLLRHFLQLPMPGRVDTATVMAASERHGAFGVVVLTDASVPSQGDDAVELNDSGAVQWFLYWTGVHAHVRTRLGQ